MFLFWQNNFSHSYTACIGRFDNGTQLLKFVAVFSNTFLFAY